MTKSFNGPCPDCGGYNSPSPTGGGPVCGCPKPDYRSLCVELVKALEGLVEAKRSDSTTFLIAVQKGCSVIAKAKGVLDAD